MNFSPADLHSAIKRGIGPQDPRFLRTVEENKMRRHGDMQDSRVRGILSGSRVETSWPSARAWLAATPGAHAPIWLGHDPKTTLHIRGDRQFLHFAAKGTHEATLFEIQGSRYQRLV